MPNKFKIFLFVLLFFLIATPVTAALLWPFQIGTVYEFRRSDKDGDWWTVQSEVLEEVTLGSRKYFHVRQWNYRPGEVNDFYFRVTDTAAYSWTGAGEELGFQIGPVGTAWSGVDVFTEIVAIEPGTVPYGGPYTAYVNRKNKLNTPYWYEYVVPGLGIVKEVDYWTEDAPKINELIRICYDGAADFTADTTSGPTPLTVNFSDQSCGTITSLSWNFGDGSTSTEQNPIHTYVEPETYTVSLTVTGPGGSDIETKNNYIKVENIPDGWETIQGTVTHNGTPLCAMVLANGQYMFSCDPYGEYQLSVPLDDYSEITLFAFVDGLAPFKVTSESSSLPSNIEMQLASPDSKTPTVTSTVVESIDNPGWVEIGGSVSLDGTPLCAMVLANGQYMFSCDPYGEYQLSVPLDANGEITLFVFVDGLQPYKEIISFDDDNDSDGYSISQGDCDDFDASINPGAIEICGDGIDQDCDGSDKDCSSNGGGDWDCEVVTSGPSTLTIINDLNVGVSTDFQNAAFGSDIRPNKCEIYGYSGIQAVEFTQCNFSGDTCYENTFGITVTVSISDGMTIRTSDLF